MHVRLATPDDAVVIGRLLHDFNVEYDEPTPPAGVLADRLRTLMAAGTAVLLAGDAGLCVLRFQPAIWTENLECYLAELYVRPEHRGHGLGRALLSAGLEHARERGADYVHLGTTEDDVAARRLYEKAGFRRTEGDGGPLMFVYEREL
jgi:ribosomal protein S18 acetylase RimI-like enzyme